MAIGGFRVHPSDNVATLLADAGPGQLVLGGGGKAALVPVIEKIELGHKVALDDIAEGQAIRKFGVTIGVATRSIRRGEWVHLHNCRSLYDTRSATLDLHTGVTTDMTYE